MDQREHASLQHQRAGASLDQRKGAPLLRHTAEASWASSGFTYVDSMMARFLQRKSLFLSHDMSSLRAKIAVFCDNSPLKNARAS
jgi:hypothetical protein